MTVAFTERNDIIRIITARKATKKKEIIMKANNGEGIRENTISQKWRVSVAVDMHQNIKMVQILYI